MVSLFDPRVITANRQSAFTWNSDLIINSSVLKEARNGEIWVLVITDQQTCDIDTDHVQSIVSTVPVLAGRVVSLVP